MQNLYPCEKNWRARFADRTASQSNPGTDEAASSISPGSGTWHLRSLPAHSTPDAARFAAHSDIALFFACPDVDATIATPTATTFPFKMRLHASEPRNLT